MANISTPSSRTLYVSLLHPPKAAGRSIEATLTFPQHQAAYSGLHLEHPLNDKTWILHTTTGHNRYSPLADELDRIAACPGIVTASIALLRDPVTRAISEFYTNRGRRASQRQGQYTVINHLTASGELARALIHGNITLEQYAFWANATETAYNDNRMVGMLTNYNPDPSRLRLAKARLATYDMIFLQERYDESLALLNCHIHRLTGSYLDHFHTASNFNPYQHAIPPTVTAALRKRYNLDTGLYDYGVKLFEEQLAQVQDQPCFKVRYTCPKEAMCFEKHRMKTPLGTKAALIAKHAPKDNSKGDHVLGNLSERVLCVSTCNASAG
eukprot:TRINITY_DN14205_c0_g1_i1.p1 TRINITY_DN14205_c0_g1~~TRINITY_DN14205_c0_g1_i1.p1  ORF type:complete len:376 (+),score=42.46 TRINITY_DN14205_c0_g1_i1:148-1128(+)